MNLIISPNPTPPSHVFPRSSSSSSSSSWRVSCFHNTKKTNQQIIRARDRVIDFGKHKGKMLGMLSSEYLKWMSNNLNTGDFEKWGKLADDVLEDEVYADRIEWEAAERLLTGDGVVGLSGCGVAGELEEMSNRFGWDYNDKSGWSKVDFVLLGTSKGGRLPRRVHRVYEEETSLKKPAAGKQCIGGGGGGEREKRREGAAKRRDQQMSVGTNEEELNMFNNNNSERIKELKGVIEDDKMSRRSFPGRQYLIHKVLHSNGS